MEAGVTIAASAETPSGKGAADENFPVGSWLLPAHLRDDVACYYAFARAIDDVADNPALSPDDKIERLSGFEAAVRGEHADAAYAKGLACGAMLKRRGIDTRHANDLISAFKQDAIKGRYQSWAELIDYCDRSAAPVGRFLLALHGEDEAGFGYSDALCNSLQVINHLQDCADDYRSMDRVYLPLDWMEAEGARIEDLGSEKMSPRLRAVADRCLSATRDLLMDADRLVGALKSTRLAAESAVIVTIAHRLVDRLEHEDPIATRVELSKPAFLWCGLRGAAWALFRRRP